MPSFQYQGRDRQGKIISGALMASDIVEVREIMRQSNVFLTRVEEQRETVAAPPAPRSRKRVKLEEMVVMTRQLATLVHAGLPIVLCLYEVAEQTENPTLKEALQLIRNDVLTGSTLTAAMRKHPRLFSELFLAMIEAGETSGMLEQSLETLSAQLHAEADLREKVKAAMTYPIVVLAVAVFVVFFMLIFIVPEFNKVYQQFNAKLPAITLSLVALSQIIVHYWWAVGISLCGLYYSLKQYHSTQEGRRFFDKIRLKLPLVGKLLRKIAVARFCQTFGNGIHAGIPLLNALSVAGGTSNNVIIIDALERVASLVKDGSNISDPLEQSGQFPSLVTRMIAAGEQSGNLDHMLEEVTRFYNREIEYSVNRLTRLMEPAMTIIIGVIVLFILLALYMPVFNMTQAIHTK